MDARMMEVLAFVDGVDAMTSKHMQARRSYEPAEMLLNEQVGLGCWVVCVRAGVWGWWWLRCAVHGAAAAPPCNTPRQCPDAPLPIVSVCLAVVTPGLGCCTQFEELHLEMRGGKLGLDFTDFDTTRGSTGVFVVERVG
jgi:hypothetical protein